MLYPSDLLNLQVWDSCRKDATLPPFIWMLFALYLANGRPFLCPCNIAVGFESFFSSGITQCSQAYLVLLSPSPEVSHSSKESRFSLVGSGIADQDLPASEHIATDLWIYLLSPLNCYASGRLVEQLCICGHTDECRHHFQLMDPVTTLLGHL